MVSSISIGLTMFLTDCTDSTLDYRNQKIHKFICSILTFVLERELLEYFLRHEKVSLLPVPTYPAPQHPHSPWTLVQLQRFTVVQLQRFTIDKDRLRIRRHFSS